MKFETGCKKKKSCTNPVIMLYYLRTVFSRQERGRESELKKKNKNHYEICCILGARALPFNI